MKLLTGPKYLPDSGKISSAVIFLHGLGSNGDDLISLAPIMTKGLPETVFLSPNAPHKMPFSAGGYQWFEYWDRTPLQMWDGIKNAAPYIVDFVYDVSDRYKLPLDKIVLCGFSQGTMMSLYTGLRMIEGLGGVIGFAGALLSPETLMMEKVSHLPPVLLVHGLQDTIVPAIASMQAEMVLKALNVDVKYVQRPNLAHSIDDKGIQESVAFCQKVFNN